MIRNLYNINIIYNTHKNKETMKFFKDTVQ